MRPFIFIWTHDWHIMSLLSATFTSVTHSPAFRLTPLAWKEHLSRFSGRYNGKKKKKINK